MTKAQTFVIVLLGLIALSLTVLPIVAYIVDTISGAALGRILFGGFLATVALLICANDWSLK